MLADAATSWLYRNQRGWLKPISKRRAATMAAEIVARHDSGQRSAWSQLLPQLRRSPYHPAPQLVVETLVELRAIFAEELGLRAHPVQLQAVLLLLAGFGCQLRTGEGKSLVAAMAAATAACAGRRVSVYTVNDYLAERDCGEFRRCFERIGVSAEALLESEPEPQRLSRYTAKVLYMAPRVAIFDSIRQQVRRAAERAQTPRWSPPAPKSALDRALEDMAIVDEADALLIDEATIPFVLSAPIAQRAEELALLEEVVALLAEVDATELLGDGQQRTLPASLRQQLLAELGEHYAQRHGTLVLEHALAQGVVAMFALQRDRDYLVTASGVEIVDPHTGRPSPERRWEQGLHQLVELKEGLTPTAGTRTEAMMIYPEFFARFRFLSGMSGTLQGARWELWKNYRMHCRTLNPHRPLAVVFDALVVARDQTEQLALLLARLADSRRAGRAVLLGTRSVGHSHRLSEALRGAGVEHQLLNATTLAEESAIVAAAGQPGKITVATAMAGRGTDIKLSAPVAAAGGLEVILLQRHDLHRNDMQFYGRSGRQGAPGRVAMLLSLDDPLFGEAGEQLSLAALLLQPLPIYWRSRVAALLLMGRQWYTAKQRRRQREALKKEQKRLKSFYAVIGNRHVD